MRVASPTTPAALFSYLLGTWTLTKTLEYQRGGRSGNFRGSAQFMPLSAGVEGVLSYEETGVATLEPNMEALEARHALLYDCSDATDVKVYFDEAINRAPADVLTGCITDIIRVVLGGSLIPAMKLKSLGTIQVGTIAKPVLTEFASYHPAIRQASTVTVFCRNAKL